MAVDITKYFDNALVDIAEIQEIIKTINAEFDLLYNKINKTLHNMFILDLDADGCARYESFLGIIPRGDDTLEDRRFRILTMYKSNAPYTLLYLKRSLEVLCGEGNVEIVLDADNYNVQIWIGLASKNQYDTAYKLVKQMLPCNLTLNYALKYNQHSTLHGFTHAQLANYTHYQIRNEVLGG